MKYYEKEDLERWYKIVTEHRGLNEFLKRIEENINESYSKEQCYKDILENAEFNFGIIKEFIKLKILSENKEDAYIIMQNLKLLDLSCFSELLQYLKEDYECKGFLKNEIKRGMINNQDLSRAFVFYKFLKSEEDGKQIIEERIEDFISAGYDFELINIMVHENENLEKEILENKAKILKNAKGENIISFIKFFNERDALNEKDINLEDFVKGLYSTINDKITLKMLEIIYKELMDKQNLTIKDIELFGKGQYNSNYKIGQFILKVGETRQTKQIPYHRKILQPIIRQDTNHPFEENNIYIEIQNEVDNKWYENMTEQQIEEEIYNIYKEMREDGLVWTDIKKENIGRLIKPNKTNYYTETLEGNIKEPNTLKVVQKELDVSDNSIGIYDRKKEECMQPGELVILDTDFIYKQEDINIEEEIQEKPPLRYIRYEKRYRYELEQKRNKSKEQR